MFCGKELVDVVNGIKVLAVQRIRAVVYLQEHDNERVTSLDHEVGEVWVKALLYIYMPGSINLWDSFLHLQCIHHGLQLLR